MIVWANDAGAVRWMIITEPDGGFTSRVNVLLATTFDATGSVIVTSNNSPCSRR
jgi:hypothetical protein